MKIRNHLFYPIIPDRFRHPDTLAGDLRTGKGEFSVWYDIAFERYLQKIAEVKARMKEWNESYQADINTLRQKGKEKLLYKGRLEDTNKLKKGIHKY